MDEKPESDAAQPAWYRRNPLRMIRFAALRRIRWPRRAKEGAIVGGEEVLKFDRAERDAAKGERGERGDRGKAPSFDKNDASRRDFARSDGQRKGDNSGKSDGASKSDKSSKSDLDVQLANRDDASEAGALGGLTLNREVRIALAVVAMLVLALGFVFVQKINEGQQKTNEIANTDVDPTHNAPTSAPTIVPEGDRDSKLVRAPERAPGEMPDSPRSIDVSDAHGAPPTSFMPRYPERESPASAELPAKGAGDSADAHAAATAGKYGKYLGPRADADTNETDVAATDTKANDSVANDTTNTSPAATERETEPRSANATRGTPTRDADGRIEAHDAASEVVAGDVDAHRDGDVAAHGAESKAAAEERVLGHTGDQNATDQSPADRGRRVASTTPEAHADEKAAVAEEQAAARTHDDQTKTNGAHAAAERNGNASREPAVGATDSATTDSAAIRRARQFARETPDASANPQRESATAPRESSAPPRERVTAKDDRITPIRDHEETADARPIKPIRPTNTPANAPTKLPPDVADRTTNQAADEASVPSDAESPATRTRIYQVRAGETVYDIARRELGRVSRWREIVALNRNSLGDDIDAIAAGMKLRIPDERRGGSVARQRDDLPWR